MPPFRLSGLLLRDDGKREIVTSQKGHFYDFPPVAIRGLKGGIEEPLDVRRVGGNPEWLGLPSYSPFGEPPCDTASAPFFFFPPPDARAS